jgi:hypothetical protein
MGKHLTGQLVHHGKVLTDGNWEPIIDRGTHKAVVALLSDPKRRQQSSTARVYLLAGLATCGTCGAALRGRPAWKGQVAAYQCSTGKHCQRSVELVDLRVSEAMIRRLEKSNAEGVWVDNSAADEAAHWELEVQALEDRRKGAARLFAQGRIDEDTLADTTTELDEELSAIRANLDQARVDAKRPLAALKGLTGPGARHAWRMAPLGRKRAAIEALVSSVELHGSGRGMPFDPERHVTIAWRDDKS